MITPLDKYLRLILKTILQREIQKTRQQDVIENVPFEVC